MFCKEVLDLDLLILRRITKLKTLVSIGNKKLFMNVLVQVYLLI